jgi:hypothetical protein
LEILKERSYLGEPAVDGRILLTFILKEYGRMVWAGFIWPVAGSYEYGDEPSGSIKGREVFD